MAEIAKLDKGTAEQTKLAKTADLINTVLKYAQAHPKTTQAALSTASILYSIGKGFVSGGTVGAGVGFAIGVVGEGAGFAVDAVAGEYISEQLEPAIQSAAMSYKQQDPTLTDEQALALGIASSSAIIVGVLNIPGAAKSVKNFLFKANEIKLNIGVITKDSFENLYGLRILDRCRRLWYALYSSHFYLKY